MGSTLDIAGSFILAGMMLMAFNMFVLDKQDAEVMATNSVIRQSNISEATQLMMWDIRKVGYGCDPSKAVLRAEKGEFVFRGDVDNNGTLDSVGYSFKEGISHGNNKKDLLYRSFNGTTVGSDLDIRRMSFTYLDKNKNVTTVGADVKIIIVSMEFEERLVNPGDTGITRRMDFRITPRNLFFPK